MALDPQYMMLKYHTTRQIPYEKESCTKRMSEAGRAQEMEYANYDDEKATQTYSKMFYMQLANKKKKFDVKKHTIDVQGNRHWSVHPSKDHHKSYKTFGKHPTSSPVANLKVSFDDLVCKRVKETYVKDFIIVNEIKTKYCLNLYKKFLGMDSKYLLRFMPMIKNYLMQNMNVKGGVYCSICDAHQQAFFNIEKKKVMVKEHFCRSLLHEKKDLLTFMHVFFIEYMDSLLQYTQCFETDAKIFGFPFKNFMEKFKRRIALVKSCLAATEGPGFMDKCWFVCKNYKFFGVDWFFNGDVALVKRAYLTIFSFLHKMNQAQWEYEKKKKVPGYVVDDNVNGLLVEPLNSSYAVTEHYYLENPTRKKLLGKLDLRVPPPKPLTKKKKKKVVKKADKQLKKLGLPTIKEFEKLKKDHKELKKKFSEISEVDKKVAKYDKLKKFRDKVKMKNMSAKAKKAAKKKDETTPSGLANQLLKIRKKSQIHEGLRVPRVLLNDPEFVSGVKSALIDFGLPEHVIEQQLTKSRIKARFLKAVEDKKAKEDKKSKEQKTNEEKEKREAKEKKEAEENAKLLADEEKEREKKMNQPAKDPSRFKLNTVIIENANQIYEKNKEAFGVKNFDILWGEDGINPFKSFELINYKFNITSLIGKKIQEEEKIANSVITSFVTTSSKFVNRFNFDYYTLIMDADTVTDTSYIKNQKIAMYAKLNNRVALLAHAQKRINQIIKRHAGALKRNKMFKDTLKRNKALKIAKQEAKLNTKVIMNNHIDQPHFHENFSGFKQYFLKIFGH